MQYRKAIASDFPHLIALQNENLVTLLSEEEKSDGFLSASFSEEQFAKFNENLAVIVAVDEANEDKLLAFLVTSTVESNLAYPLPAAMIARYPLITFEERSIDSYKSFVSGPVCVAKSERGKGIFEGLYHALPSLLPSDYELAVALVSTSNPRSLRAHEKVGMQRVDQFEFASREFVTVVKILKNTKRA